MKMNSNLYENININNEIIYLSIQHDGRFVLREPRKDETLINRFLIPTNTKKRQKMERKMIHLIRKGKITLKDGYIITPNGQCVKSNQKILNQLQKGGYELRDGVPSKRKRPSSDDDEEERVIQRQRFGEEEDDFNLNMFDIVCVQYRMYYVMHVSGTSIRTSRGGMLRNVLRGNAEREIQQEADDFVERRNHDTEITAMNFTIIDIPQTEVPLMQQRMYGTKINYHYLNVESNYTEENDCVYQFLVTHYSKWIKNLTRESLLALFMEEDFTSGVNTAMINIFCREYGVSLYAADLEMKVFNKYIPVNRSHSIPPLVYVCGNAHLYPILDNSTRKSIFASERNKSSSFQFKGKADKQSFKFNPKLSAVLNPKYNELAKLKDCNVIYTEREDGKKQKTSLLSLVLYLYKTEKTIYKTNGYNGEILRIQYTVAEVDDSLLINESGGGISIEGILFLLRKEGIWRLKRMLKVPFSHT